MASTYSYRILKSSWGVAVDLTAEAVPLDTYTGEVSQVADDIYLAVRKGVGVLAEDVDYLRRGLLLVSDQIRASRNVNGGMVIHVTEFSLPVCDYQAEGAACAIAGWAAQEFGFSQPAIPVEFDRAGNRYVFDLGAPDS